MEENRKRFCSSLVWAPSSADPKNTCAQKNTFTSLSAGSIYQWKENICGDWRHGLWRGASQRLLLFTELPLYTTCYCSRAIRSTPIGYCLSCTRLCS